MHHVYVAHRLNIGTPRHTQTGSQEFNKITGATPPVGGLHPIAISAILRPLGQQNNPLLTLIGKSRVTRSPRLPAVGLHTPPTGEKRPINEFNTAETL